MAQQYQDKPIVFIGVNSGTNPQQVAAYARQTRIPWPVIADVTRELEQKVGIPEISLQNIMQAAYISADGQLRRASWSDRPATIDRALVGASWKVDPATIPANLRNAWKAIEFGKYSLAATDVTKLLRASDPQTKQAADSLYAIVDADLKKDAAAAWELGQQKDLYGAYVAMNQLQERFEGYEIPERITSTLAWLRKQESVKNEEQAQKIMAEAKRLLAAPNNTVRKRAKTQIQNIVKRFPKTNAATEAQRLIEAGGP